MGKMMGGSNSHNALVHNRGHSMDYDNWADLTRDESWRYENLLSLFKKSENYIGKFPGDQHGTGGPLTVSTDSSTPILSTWLKAGKELNYKVGDPNGPQTEGFTASEVTKRLGRRQSTFVAFLQPVRKLRRNLRIVKFAEVSRIIYSSTSPSKAIGVSYIRHKTQLSAFADKEIIISAGVFGSPLLLFKSGIGPANMLAEAEISPLVANLPVGSNLQDHPGVLLGPFSINDPSKLSNVYNNLTESKFNKYSNLEEDGVLSATALGPQAFFVSSHAVRAGNRTWPDIQFFHSGTNFGGTGNMKTVTNEFSIAILVGRPDPETAGTIKLRTKAYREGITDDTLLAVVDYNFLGSSRDREVLLEGIQLALRIFDTDAFRALDTKLIPDSGCVQYHPFNSSSYWDCFIEKIGTTWWHTAGTCRMGYGPDDPKAVVDSKFRVIGVRNLRVADASVMPCVTNANTNAPVILIGEKLAAELLAVHQPQLLGPVEPVFKW